MDQAALYLGYAIMVIIAIAIVGIVLLELLSISIGIYRIIKYKQTSKLISKYEARNLYKTSKTAVDFLMSKGIYPDNKISEVLDMIERYRKRNKI